MDAFVINKGKNMNLQLVTGTTEILNIAQVAEIILVIGVMVTVAVVTMMDGQFYKYYS